MPLSPGTKIGTYEIQAPLGAGGMGAVYKAHDPTLQRTVAIKVLAKQDEDASARLLQEARAASALNHPNICTIHEVGEHEGQAFIVMEHVEGKPLSALIPADGLPPESVIRYGTQIADALAHAHERGIVHRDLKSANVVITPEGRAKVLDFGLAARMPQADAEAVTKTQEAIPHAGMLVGTLACMAPEVLRGEQATARSDIWALGVLLYEMASGRLPFGGKTAFDVTAAIAKDAPDALPARVPAGLRTVVQRCLQKEPGGRYANVVGVVGGLEAIQSDKSAPSAMPWARSTTTAVVGGVTVLALTAIGVAYFLRSPTAPVGESVLRLANPAQISRAIGVEDAATWSPDRQRLAYQSEETGNWDIWVAQVGGQRPVNLTADHGGIDQRPSWSPDGTQIAFVSDREGLGYYTMSALGGIAQKVMDNNVRRPRRPQWSVDGSELAGIVIGSDGNAAIEIASLHGRESRRLDLPQSTFGFDLSWSSSGRFFALVESLGYDSEVTRLWVLRVSDGELLPITDGRTNVWSPNWSSDEHTLYFVTNQGGSKDFWQQAVTEDGRPDGAPKSVTTGIGLRNAALAPDGSKLAYSRGGRVANVWRVPIREDREATWNDAEQVTFDQAFIEFVELHGERRFVSSDRMGNQDLWELATEGSAMRQLTTEPTPDWSPRVSPDGGSLLFYSYRSGNRDLWVMPLTGGPAQQLTSHEATDMLPTWSPDGEQIAFVSERSGNQDIWVISRDGGEPRQLVADLASDSFPRWSPDGEWVGFVSMRTDSSGVWRVPGGGGDAERLADDATLLAWSPDGRAIYIARPDALWEVSLDAGRERRLMELTGKRGALSVFGSAAFDGHYLYFVWREDQGDIWVMDVVRNDGSDD